MSKNDTGLDLPISKEELQNLSEKDIKDRREDLLNGMGLLVIYPISKDSAPGKGAKGKTNLEAVDNIIGLGIVFPSASEKSRGSQSYVWVDPTLLKPEELDEEEEEEDENA
jgi:hypothetical protein